MLWETAPVKKIKRLVGENFPSWHSPRVQELVSEGHALWGIYHVNNQSEGLFYNVAVEIELKDPRETLSEALFRYTGLLFKYDVPLLYTREWIEFRVVYSQQPWWRMVWSELWWI